MTRTILAALLAGAALPAGAACIFDGDDEITNPFATGCGDVLFTYTDDDNSGNHIALGFPPPVPVASMTPVDGLSRVRVALRAAPVAARDARRGGRRGRRQTVAGREIWAYVIGDADATTAEGFDEGRRAGERRHPRARVADARGRDRGVRNAGRAQERTAASVSTWSRT